MTEREEEMAHWIKGIAVVLSLAAALLTALAGSWRNLPVLTLALRCLIAAALVFAFVRTAGELAGKAVLRGLAEHEVTKEQPRPQDAPPEETPADRQAA